jgi:hypothetical protein
MTKQQRRLMAGLPLAALLVSCGDFNKGLKDGYKEGSGNDSKKISRADLGDDWPLTVDSGTIACDGSKGVGAATFSTGGKVYALNGLAKSKGKAAFDPFWAADPKNPGAKNNIGPLIDRTLALCK